MFWVFRILLLYVVCRVASPSEVVKIPVHNQSLRIVKGFKAPIEAFPYAVFLYFDVSRPSACGSTLITVKTVLTSAYCLREMKVPKGGIHAYLGASVPLMAKVVRNVTAYKIHPNYHPERGFFDLGLALLDRTVPMKREIHKIPISLQAMNINETLFTAGWGKQWPNTVPDYSYSRHLKVSKQRVLSSSECYAKTGFKIHQAFLCTLPINGYHYRGDMGNGLVTTRPKLSLVGVVSFMKGDVTLYASARSERQWIIKTVKQLYKKEPVDKDCC